MNNDELVTRRAQAIAEDRCFSKGRLRDEFRMKPAPGAEPVKWYKNTYGGRFAVYRIADCVPMREKRPLTSKQQLAGQRLSVLSRLNSTSGRMARQAYDWLSLAPLFLDRGLTLSGTKTHVKQRFLPLTPLLMVSDDLWSPVLPA